MVNQSHCTLMDFNPRHLRGIYSVARLKLCWVGISNTGECTNSIDKLREALKGKPPNKRTSYLIVDETVKEVQTPNNTISYTQALKGPQQDLEEYYQHCEVNDYIASNHVLTMCEKTSLIKCASKFPPDNSIWQVVKARFKNGTLEVLIANPEKTTLAPSSSCVEPSLAFATGPTSKHQRVM